MSKTKEEWKEVAKSYIEENKNRDVSLFEIYSLHGAVPKELKEAVEELGREGSIEIFKKDDGKRWLRAI